MTRKMLMASLLSASALAFAGGAAAGGPGYDQSRTGAEAMNDLPTPTRTMSEGLMAQSSLQQMEIRSSAETAVGTAASPGADILPTTETGLQETPAATQADRTAALADQDQEAALLDTAAASLQRSSYPVVSLGSTASEGLAHEQLALEQRVLFAPADQVTEPHGLLR